MYFEKLCDYLSELSEVEAMALGGSRAGLRYDEKSDYDLYLYCSATPSEEKREQILQKCCSYIELGNHFWELEDDCTLKDGVDIDILYRNLDSFADEVSSVVDKHIAHNGYTTCMWHNLIQSKILFDRNGRLQKLKEKYTIPYPLKLRENIISNNLRLLTGNLPSYDKQIIKAVKRNDLISVNHRTAAYMESYFDIIFAMNELTIRVKSACCKLPWKKQRSFLRLLKKIFLLYIRIFSVIRIELKMIFCLLPENLKTV